MKAYFYVVFLLFSSCATFKVQYGENVKNNKIVQHSDPIYSIYLVGDAGMLDQNNKNLVLQAVEKKLKNETDKSAIIYLGDNIYPKGMPKKNSKDRAKAEKIIDFQINITKGYKGKKIFIPGNHDLKNGLKGLNRQRKYIEKKLDNKDVYFPKKNCPLQKLKINDAIEIIVINSQWYLENWNKTPTINDDCEIKTRDKFFEELEGLIKKSEGKTTIIAMHHPIFSNGIHGGYFSFKQQFSPFPVIGSLANLIRKTGGVSPQDLQNKRYLEFRKRIIALAQYNSKLIFVSGHEHNLQYIHKDNITQIISGSAAKKSAIKKNINGFGYPNYGYAKLNIFKDGSSNIQFYGIDIPKNNLLFQKEIFSANKINETKKYNSNFPKYVKSSIYTEEETAKSKMYQFLWGKRYRKYYSEKIKAKTVNLDTLFGGLTPKRKGGGHQSVSLVLKTKEGKEYIMRAMRKSALKYIQTTGFKNQNVTGLFDDTTTEKIIADVFTASHPYAPYTIATLSDAVNILHTNPKLYYVPKQKALKGYNKDYGDALYMIEERASSGHGDLKSFGYINKVISTDDLLKKLRKSNHYKLDQTEYIKARLFDMVIGDWDRHQDQWRWSQYKNKEGFTVFKPLPRDRDQAFSIMSDGFLLGIAANIVPSLKLLKSYDDKLKNPKWFNVEPYPLDMTLINATDKSVWDTQVTFIKNNLTEAVIDEAFKSFPNEVQDETIKKIKQKLLKRISNLQNISNNYYNIIHRKIVLKGTDKKDIFEITRLKNGKTQVIAYQNKKKHKGKIYLNKTFNHKVTKEILIYGLDDNDYFKVSGKGTNLIPIRLIGGQNNDTYNIINGKKIKITDYQSKKNTFITKKGNHQLTDNYQKNTYYYKNAIYNTNQIMPSIGSNKDDGIKIGLKNTYINKNFNEFNFIQKQVFYANYFTETEGFEFKYNGEFNSIYKDFKLNLEAYYTSPNYSLNFFGFGNETKNLDYLIDDDYNRVRIKTISFAPSLVRKGVSGSTTKIALSYENLETEKTENRFVETANINNILPNYIFDNQNFIGTSFMYSFVNKDNKAFPTLGLLFSFELGYKNNLKTNKDFSYLISTFGFDYKLNKKGSIVFATKLKSHINLNTNFEFYHAASIGADDGLRGYRNQRFTGKNSFYQTTDLRFEFNKIKTSLIPINMGLFAGFDYGRVWYKNDDSSIWHTSYGGGFIMNMTDLMGLKIGLFRSPEDTLYSFGLNIGF